MALSGFGLRILPQEVDLKFGFEAAAAPGEFAVLGFEGSEDLFDCFEITVDLVADHDGISLSDLLDTPATLSILHAYDAPRFLHGVIAEVEKRGSGMHRTFYRATLKPALHRLQYFSDSRIFQAQTVPEISRTILEEHNIPDISWKLEMDHQPREYCVMYGETGFDFLRRIWAEEGILFYFEHSANGHAMVITDAPLAMPMLAAAENLTYNNSTGGTAKGFWVNRFDQIERLRATNRMSADYSFHSPAYHQQHKVAQYADNGAKGTYELYHYPGRHKSSGAGQPFNDHALEAHRVDATTAEGETNNIQLSVGFTFGLSDHNDASANTNHRLLQVRHKGEQPAALEEEAPAGGATTYKASFVTQPARIPYRPINPNPKPMVEGPQIAHVTGPEGEEIYCDEHGRCKIWYPWDRHGEKNEKSSCWVRVSQNWAGGTWGHIAIPRIGQEVVVDFLGGDPDQPIITGRTYHATNKPPYPLPEHKTRMTIKSQTHKGKGFNELRFEDQAGKEEVFVHAQKDKNEKTLNNHTERTDNNFVQSVGHNKSVEVFNNHDEVVGGNVTITVGPSGIGSIVNEALSKMASGIGKIADGLGLPGILNPGEGNYSIFVEKSKSEFVGVTSAESVGGNKSLVAGISNSISVGKDMHENIGNKYIVTVGEQFEIACGKSRFIMLADGTVKILGNNFYFSSHDDFVIEGKDVKVN